MFVRHLSVVLCSAWTAFGSLTNSAVTVMAVVGAGGQEDYQKQFEDSARHWEQAARTAEAEFVAIGTESGGTNDIEFLKDALTKVPKEGAEPFWLVLLGHGTFDGKEAKFNLRGPDVSAKELAQWLQPFQRPVVVVDTASASAPFINALSRSNRVIITATRSGQELNLTRFGKYISEAIADSRADLDKDGQTSLLEAFLSAARQTLDFYKAEGRLATEHALLDDNGDGLGTQADWFRGVRAVKKPDKGATIDGLRAHQIHLIRNMDEKQLPPALRARRDELEISISRLRDAKAQMKEDEYYRQLEPMLLEMARLYQGIER
ncbi:MAG TPA: hypothetical protein VK615_06975 [Candidatus Binatia bacterium]|nr:hypothetical protein [Candidatus Binatia bacterium]